MKSALGFRALTLVGAVMFGCGDDGVNTLPDAPGGIDAPPAEPGELRLSPSIADFGTVVVGSTSTGSTITVMNVGDGPTGNISAAVSGAMGSNFAVDATTCTVLAPSATCTITVTFAPTSMGAKTAALAVTASPGGTQMAVLDGTGIAPGALMISPSTHAFGSVIAGDLSVGTQTFTVTNTGGVTTGALITTVGGSNPGEFTKASDTCNGQALAGGATCALTVRFAPQSAGSKFASFAVSGSPGGMVAAAVNGVGLAPAQLVATPTSQSFGSVVVNSSSANVTFNVANLGGVPSGTLAQTLGGTDLGDFTILSSTCSGATVAPASACQVTARFSPLSVGAKAATITLAGTPGGAVTLDLGGTGIAAGALTITPSTHTFPNTTVGAPTAPQVFTVTNTGGTSTGALGAGVGGTDASQFSIGANTCTSAVLAPNGTCTISVTFAPSTQGSKSGSLFVSGTPGGAIQASLSGNALPTAQLVITPASHNFGSVGVGGQTGFTEFNVQNQGGTTSGAPTVMLVGANAGQFMHVTTCAGGLAPLATCTVSVRFNPSTIGNHTATVSVSASPGGAVSANVFGQGVNPAALSVNPSSLSFPLTLLGDTSPILNFTVTNNGGGTTGALGVTTSGAAGGDFNIVSNSCTTLAPGGICSISVQFEPSVRGLRTASINVAGSPGGSVSVGASGNALPRLEIISVDGVAPVDPFDYGTRVVNSYTGAQIVVRNNTTSDQDIDFLGSFGSPAQFTVDSFSCGRDLKDLLVAHGGPTALYLIAGNGGTCRLYVDFNPQTVGVKNGSVVFNIGAGVLNQASQGLRGTGIEALTIRPEFPGGEDFGNVAIGQTSAPRTFIVRNDSSAPTSGSLAIIGVQTSRYALEPMLTTCDGTLGSGAECQIVLRFSPVVLGPDPLVLGVSATPGGNPTINITGTGVNPNNLIINPTPLNFGDVFSGDIVVRTITVTNPAGAQPSGPLSFAVMNDSCGIVNLGPGSGGIGGACFTVLPTGTCVSGSTVLLGGQSCTVHVEFDSFGSGQGPGPTAVGPGFGLRTGSMTFFANPGTDGPVNVNLSANVRSTISMTPSSHAFGTVAATDMPTTTFTVKNESPDAVNIPSANFYGTSAGLSVVANGCSSAPLLPNALCDITVVFGPEASVSLDALFEVSTIGNTGVGQATITGQRVLPTSCLALLSSAPTTPTGDYLIDVDVYGPQSAVSAFCDMDTDGGGYTMLPISGGLVSYRRTDNDSCKALGLNIAVPRTQAHLNAMTGSYPSNFFTTIPGVYGLAAGNYSTSNPSLACAMNSSDATCAANWKAIDGGSWFAAAVPRSEPNGDYTPDCWLLADGADANGFIFNDFNCLYSTGSSYVCSTNDKGAPVN